MYQGIITKNLYIYQIHQHLRNNLKQMKNKEEI
jgi:hypothetical protein